MKFTLFIAILFSLVGIVISAPVPKPEDFVVERGSPEADNFFGDPWDSYGKRDVVDAALVERVEPPESDSFFGSPWYGSGKRDAVAERVAPPETDSFFGAPWFGSGKREE